MDKNDKNKPVGNWTLRIAQMSWRTDPQTMSESMTDMQILGSKFWALGGLKQKSKKPVL